MPPQDVVPSVPWIAAPGHLAKGLEVSCALPAFWGRTASAGGQGGLPSPYHSERLCLDSEWATRGQR